jgi:putative membrane protein insertion efficiency factor
MTRIFVGAIRLYQILISPLLPPNSCRFYPSCSYYSIDALEKYGPWKGLWLTILRIGKCHPWHEGGYDPVN